MQPPYPPAQYPPPQPPKKGIPAWAWVLIGCGCLPIPLLAILAAILFPVFSKARDKARVVACVSNERQTSLALIQYAQDFDQKLPPGAAWMDRTQPYIGNEKSYHCPSVAAGNPQNYGYAFDSRTAGKPMNRLPRPPEQTMMLYDSTNLGRSATDAGTSLPSPGRHGSGTGNDIAYADGHIMFVRRAGGP